MEISTISVQHQHWSLHILSHNPRHVCYKAVAPRTRKSLSQSHPVYTNWVIPLDNQVPAIFSKCHLNTVRAASRVSFQYFWEGGWVTGHVSPFLLKHTLLCAWSPFPHSDLREKARVYLDTMPGRLLMYRDAYSCLRNEWGREGVMEAVF